MNGETSYVIFRVNEYQFALPVEYVIEITRMVALDSVPELGRSIRGIFTLRGVCVYCIDLKTAMGWKPEPYRTSSRIIVIGLNELYTGFMVDEVIGIQTLSENDSNMTSQIPDYIHLPFVTTVYSTSSGYVFELKPDLMLHSEHINTVQHIAHQLDLIPFPATGKET